jgi:hypothetical protein
MASLNIPDIFDGATLYPEPKVKGPPGGELEKLNNEERAAYNESIKVLKERLSKFKDINGFFEIQRDVRQALSSTIRKTGSEVEKNVQKAVKDYESNIIKDTKQANHQNINDVLRGQLQLIIQKALVDSALEELRESREEFSKAAKDSPEAQKAYKAYGDKLKNITTLKTILDELINKTPGNIKDRVSIEEETKKLIQDLDREVRKVPDDIINYEINLNADKDRAVKNFSAALKNLPKVGSVIKSELKTEDILAQFKRELVADSKDFAQTKKLLNDRAPKADKAALNEIIKAASPKAEAGKESEKDGPEAAKAEKDKSDAEDVAEAAAQAEAARRGRPAASDSAKKETGNEQDHTISTQPANQEGLAEKLKTIYGKEPVVTKEKDTTIYSITDAAGKKTKIACGKEGTLITPPQPPSLDDLKKSMEAVQAMGLSSVDISRLPPDEQARAHVAACFASFADDVYGWGYEKS